MFTTIVTASGVNESAEHYLSATEFVRGSLELVTANQDVVIMSFKWWKKQASTLEPKSRLPIKVSITPEQGEWTQEQHGHASGNSAALRTEPLPTRSGLNACISQDEASYPSGRCGFSTGVHGQTPPIDIAIIAERLTAIIEDELLRSPVMDDAHIELRPPGKATANEPPDDKQMTRPESHDSYDTPDKPGNYSLWGKRISGKHESPDSKVSINFNSHDHE
ncbi:MAG: hypothetical protein HGB29_01300 [Chlorobiaceae bacterium]|nr:hypothetical protein [Chlorobiaceae bacterium]NTW73483.1 hypothetical protein [Chlorobiaceae bacterium]